MTKAYHSREDRVAEFNEAAGNTKIDLSPTMSLDKEEKKVYNQYVLFDEEKDELKEALDSYFDALYEYQEDPSEETEGGVAITRAELVKEWADAQVTLSNLAWVLGIDGNEAFQRVHNSNMSKLTDGKLLINPDTGKVLKSESYSPPNMFNL